ncbi:MAG: fasciclin domain-containing protein [Gemmatimonadetes bacterium]|nr:fasciclin domain-containing protein [Gemmatimonadota bacterium]MYB68089.1 fasciclin domain-containing protein [Gemmatimonadota bacterium]
MNLTRIATLMALALASWAGPAQAQDEDIVDVAIGAGTFNTLVAAVQAADLVDALQGEGPLTVFAPTDEAFAALPEGTVESLLLPENKELLTAILLYHVVAGSVMAADVVELSSATTLSGDSIDISVSDSGVMINNANVVQADVTASNGVIHIIDAVLLPPPATAVESSTWGTVKQQAR